MREAACGAPDESRRSALVALIAAKKLVVVGAIGLGALVTAWFRRKRGDTES